MVFRLMYLHNIVPVISYIIIICNSTIHLPCSHSLSTASSSYIRQPNNNNNNKNNNNQVLLGGTGTPRDISYLQKWANENNIIYDDTYISCFTNPDEGYNNDDYVIKLLQDCKSGTELLKIPSSVILSSNQIREELLCYYNNDATNKNYLQSALQVLQGSGFANQIPQFYLYVKLLKEYEIGERSLWYNWIRSLPPSFTTAISMDDIEMDLLPPIAYGMAKTWKLQYTTFYNAIQHIPNDIVSESIKDNESILQWAFDAVFTRCWSYTGSYDTNGNNSTNRFDLVPFGDMFNHDTEQNIEINYNDTTDDIIITLKYDTGAGIPLVLNYGKESNAYHFLIIFGFVNTEQKELYAQLLPDTTILPKEKCKQLGFDASKLVFRCSDGSISNTVWDFILYTLLESNNKKVMQSKFYEAHIAKDHATKIIIHNQYHMECCICLKQHIDRTIREMYELRIQMDHFDTTEHPRIPLLQQNNDLITKVFQKVKYRIDTMIQMELQSRQAAETK